MCACSVRTWSSLRDRIRKKSRPHSDGHHPRVVEQLLDPGARRLVEVPASWGCIPVAKTPEIESASSRDVADVAGSTPTHSRRSTPRRPRGLDHQ